MERCRKNRRLYKGKPNNILIMPYTPKSKEQKIIDETLNFLENEPTSKPMRLCGIYP